MASAELPWLAGESLFTVPLTQAAWEIMLVHKKNRQDSATG